MKTPLECHNSVFRSLRLKESICRLSLKAVYVSQYTGSLRQTAGDDLIDDYTDIPKPASREFAI